MTYAHNDILNGWKEIAQYVARDIRTVERWEKQRGLPVRRVPGAGRATVFARISELELWLHSSNLAETEPLIALEDQTHSRPTALAIAELPTLSEAATSPTIDSPAPPVLYQPVRPDPAASLIHHKYFIPAMALILGSVFAIFITQPLARRAAAHTPPPAHGISAVSASPAGPVRQSQVPGVDALYLRGTFFFEQRTPDTLNRALQHFTAAIEKDPTYAPAYVGLANTYNLLREYSVVPDEIAFPKALEADEKAIALDPSLPQAHASLGFVKYFWSVDAPAAEREFQTALALDPSLVLAHHWYGSVLTHEGRYTEALRELDTAQRLQPSSSAIFTSRALAFGLSGHRDEARAMLEEHLSQDHNREDHNSSTTHIVLGILDMMEPHDVPGFLHEWRRGAERRQDSESLDLVNKAEAAYHHGGEPLMWQIMLAAEQKQHSYSTARTVRMADSEVLLGRPDQALADLDDLMHRHDRAIISIFVDPMLFPLQKDPRFVNLRAELRLPPGN
ncbi:hypothetical protein AciX9_1201 [Granulicella tundricola MP5ACTX9]|uniref:Uncharacterized protein n=1 Tax=Granulicella tundricola (strain ATCC BAA-1859 / DSM 23138 / MP5ACTX9) TaxID=1198114 RepID=E8X4D7_GRATM|nr:hypothetical protein AciX9_1201 [Granulicella tundricola MP5ACTX9]